MVENSVHKELLKYIAEVELNYPLNIFSPLGSGGVADYFTQAKTTVEVATAVKAAIDCQIPYLVIGQGKGVLFSDGGFPGLVVQNLTGGYALAADRSQVVVDSGMSLSSFITSMASRGLGGITQLYGQPGTVGGAVYANIFGDTGYPILSSVSYLTMLMPPARLDKEATIVRYRVDWLKKHEVKGGESLTKLQAWKLSRAINAPQPVILTVLFQLTNIRPDELQSRLKKQTIQKMPENSMGPVFAPLADTDIITLLIGANVSRLQVGGIYPDRYNPNYLLSRSKSARASDVQQLIELMHQAVKETYGVDLVHCFEYLGVW